MRNAFFVLLVILVSCSSGRTLTEQERAKLDPALQTLFSEEKADESFYDITTRSNGEKEYGVILRSSHPEELRAHGIQIAGVFGDVMTARLTLTELRKVLSLPSVRAVQNGSKNYPQ